MLFDVYLSNDPDIELLFSDNDFKVFAVKSDDTVTVPSSSSRQNWNHLS
jgi:hypothetical protein